MANEVKTLFTGDARQLQRTLDQMAARQETFERKVSQSHRRATQNASNAWKQSNLENQIKKSLGLESVNASINRLGPTLTRLSGAFAAAFSVSEAVRLADTATRVANALKVAGVEGENLARVQTQLFEIAKKNGTEIETLAGLYSRVSQSSKELGLSENQMLKITDGVAASLRVAGASAQSASGALLGLSQIGGSARITMEDFNQINEGARPILEAVVMGSDRFGGSIAKLREAVSAGTIAPKEFFAALEKGSDMMIAKAAKAPLTVAQSVTNLQTSLIEYIGKVDQSLGASEKLAAAIGLLGENLDTCGQAIVVIATALIARMVPGLVATSISGLKASASMIAMAGAISGTSAAAVLASGAMTALNRAMAFFGGPIGLAITAVAVAIMGLSASASDAKKRNQEFGSALAESNAALDQHKRLMGETKSQTQGFGEASSGAVGGVNRLAGAVKTLADETYVLADARVEAARAANLELIERNRSRISELQNPGFMTQAGDVVGAAFEMTMKNMFGRAAANINTGNAMRSRASQIDSLTAINADALARNIGYVTDPAARFRPKRDGATVTDPKTKGGGGGAESAKQIAEASQNIVREAKSRLAQVQSAIEIANAVTAFDKAELALSQSLFNADKTAEDEKRRIAKAVADKQITTAAAVQAKASVELTRQAQRELAAKEHQVAIEEARKALDQQRLENTQAVARLEEENLQTNAELAGSLAQRLSLEKQAFGVRQNAEKEAHDALMAETAQRWKLAGMLEDEIARRIAALNENFAKNQQSQATVFNQNQSKAGAFGQFKKTAQEMEAELQNVAASGLNALGDGITDAIMKTKSLGAAFKDVANQIIRDLVRIGIQRKIIEPIANSLFGPASGSKGGGGGAGSFLSTVSKFFKIGRNASGTDNWRGGLTSWNEAGSELIMLPSGSQIAPNNLLRNALSAKPASSASSPVFNLSTVVNADNAVLRDDIDRQISQSHVQAVQLARQLTANDSNRSARNRLR